MPIILYISSLLRHNESKQDYKKPKNTFDYIFGVRFFVSTHCVIEATSNFLMMDLLSCLGAWRAGGPNIVSPLTYNESNEIRKQAQP